MDEGTALLINLIVGGIAIGVVILLIVGWCKLYAAILSTADSLRAIRAILDRRERRELKDRDWAATPTVLH